RLQKGLGRTHPPAVALVDVEIADAAVVAAVEVVDARDAGLVGRCREGIEDVPAQALTAHAPFARRAVRDGGVRGTGVPSIAALMGAEIRQYVAPAPGVVTGRRRPAIVVSRLAAHVDHAVDAGAAAEHLAARVQQVTAVESRFVFGAIA